MLGLRTGQHYGQINNGSPIQQTGTNKEFNQILLLNISQHTNGTNVEKEHMITDEPVVRYGAIICWHNL